MTVIGLRVHTCRFNRTLKCLKKVIQNMDEYGGITHTNISFIGCCHVIRITIVYVFTLTIFSNTNISYSCVDLIWIMQDMQLFKVAYLEGPDFTSHIIDILLTNRNDISHSFQPKNI